MFDALTDQPEDKILSLIAAFRSDGRARKIDLGVGMYRDADGQTPVMRAVKAAERRIWNDQKTKGYTGLSGDPAFAGALAGLVLGDGFQQDRIAAAATPGGTGALHQALDLVRMTAPDATVWVPAPTWPNHLSILAHLGLRIAEYRYFDGTTGAVDFGGLIADLGRARAGDVVLLHGCCHNPTGADPTGKHWDGIIELLSTRGATALIDLAYLGFGEGLEADGAATRQIAGRLDEVMIAVSCSKNFGIYRERAGLLIGLSGDARTIVRLQANFDHLNRQTYSFPPDHGARIVTTILTDPELRADWRDELDGMCKSMQSLRESLAAELRRLTNCDRFDYLGRHRGMFSRLGATPHEVARLRDDHGIYMVADGRMNIAGLNAGTVPVLARAIAATVA